MKPSERDTEQARIIKRMLDTTAVLVKLARGLNLVALVEWANSLNKEKGTK